ncbi:hypothetical protein JYU34_007151 [Plutella xylostella]|uniref:Uncharacterized protein n=1 Tax=Plutella xylostella TaxID=51655 RepID=A0ABQ7QPP4_PLUXY|nr:hypothetical protein JYU34_007151 [Plutella xylostella]
MISKFLCGSVRLTPINLLLARGNYVLSSRVLTPMLGVRSSELLKKRTMRLIPPDQYDDPNYKIPNRFRLGYALRVYWEIIPLITCCAISIFLVIGYTLWCFKHKVDLVFWNPRDSNVSRTMDLRHPTVHKIITIHQEYPPWPEMQAVLDKMKAKERKEADREGGGDERC